jgi:hypothetical protein
MGGLQPAKSGPWKLAAKMIMEAEDQPEFAGRLHRELRQLPPLKAPQTLIPRVVSAIESKACQPWWKKSWAQWPPLARLFFVLLSAPVAGAILYFAFRLSNGMSLETIQPKVVNSFNFLAPVWHLIVALGNAFLLLIRSGGQLFIWITLGFLAAIYLSCVGLGTFCYRIALNKI